MDWNLREGEYREKLGECLKGTSELSQDQRRMLQTITHSFPSNAWIHKITKGEESNKCDTCEALSEVHTTDHHGFWRLIHGELARLASVKWKFMCISGEKNLETIWKELVEDFGDKWNQDRVR